MIASLMCHSQVIKVPQEIYEDIFSYRKFGLARSKRFFFFPPFSFWRQRSGNEGARRNESFSFASGERRSGFMLFIIRMTHTVLTEPLEGEGYKFKQEDGGRPAPTSPPLPHMQL